MSTIKDTEMKVDAAETIEAPAVATTVPLLTSVKHNLALLNRAVNLLEPRFTTRVLRTLPALRKKLDDGAELAEVIRNGAVYNKDSPRQLELLAYLHNPSPPTAATPAPTEGAMDLDVIPATKAVEKLLATIDQAVASSLPEADIYIALLVVVWLIDQKEFDQAKKLTTALIALMSELNRRTMDQLASKVYFYWVRSHELAGDDTGPLRTGLLAAQRTAALRRDDDLQATLLPLLLRNYLEHHLYDQADRLVSKTSFPEATAGNAQLARYYYYVGRIRAIQLNYTEAHQNLQQAIRRAPDARVAPGFVQTAYKLSVIVELLMGDIPERSIFRQPVLKDALLPYLEIAQAVRIGDLVKFNEALSTHSSSFDSDSNSTLILRLRHNVIKTALRTISLAYSRIPLSDVSSKLSLDSEEDAEYIVAKAIRDGVIESVVDHEKGFMRSKEAGDVYVTGEPSEAFDTRIKFLLELHNNSVKAMRYPLNVHSKELDVAGEARERERELAKEIENAGDDEDMDGGDDMDSGF